MLVVNNVNGFFTVETPILGRIHVTCDNACFKLSTGINKIIGEIDNGGWALSSLLCHQPKKNLMVIYDEIEYSWNNQKILLNDLRNMSCNISKFPKGKISRMREKSIESRIKCALKNTNSHFSEEDLKQMFGIDDQRYVRPIHLVSKNFIRANAAIGVAEGKEIFCFPWFSRKLVMPFFSHIMQTCEALEKLNKTVILPLSEQAAEQFCDVGICTEYIKSTELG